MWPTDQGNVAIFRKEPDLPRVTWGLRMRFPIFTLDLCTYLSQRAKEA